jgi:hypothetical protein
MSLRRKVLLALSFCALAGAALGVGVALGSSSSHKEPSPGVKTAAARPDMPKGGVLKCKAQACVNFDDTAVMFAGSKNVVTVGHPAVGTYCVQLKPNLHVGPNTMAITTVDYTDSPNSFIVAAQSYATGCTASGFPNSIRIYTMQDDGGTGFTFANEAVNVIVP